MSTIELLAPVGHKEGLIAAITNGADAIYVGGAAFGARKEAAFSHEELIEVIQYSHLHGVKVYVTVNTTIFDRELADLTEYIHFLYLNDADAVIVQDIGVANLVKNLYPDFELHFSTQMTIHNPSGVEFSKKFGADRVVVARENTIDEIKEMSKLGVELEVFVHGALCVSYSGQCLMSSMIGGRSGNRGACAQTCRLPYELINLKNGKVIESNLGDYLLSPRDLNTIDHIGELIEAGVTSFKIEGRLKKAEYVATVVRAYREAIDQYVTKNKVGTPYHSDLEQIFNRGFTKGYLFHEEGVNWIGAERPNHRGVLIGTVTSVQGKRVTIKLKKELDLHDGVRFVGAKDYGLEVQKMFVKNQDVKKAKPGLVSFDVSFPVQPGTQVYKTSSTALGKPTPLGDIPIFGEAHAHVGKLFKLTIWDEVGNMVEVMTPETLEKAQNTPLSEERLRQQLEKTGGTPFAFSQLILQMDSDVTLPISVLNRLRREAMDQLQKKRLTHYSNRQRSLVELPKPVAVKATGSQLSVSVRSAKQLMAVLEYEGIHNIYYRDMETLASALELAQGKRLVPQLPRIVNNEQKLVAQLKSFDTVMVGEYGLLEALKDKTVLTDFSFNTNNVQSVETLRQLGVEQVTLSYEITQKQIKYLVANASLPVEAIVYSRVPMMITRHCPIKAHYQPEGGQCKRYCMKTPHALKDRKEKLLPLLRSGNGQTEIFNAQHLIWLEYITELQAMGIANFRLEFTDETPEEIHRALSAYQTMIQQGRLDVAWLNDYKDRQDYTKGHYQRGV